ncbi:MAG: hypothetical protein AB9Q18_11610 [Candidatus Reddybacter sp.]
MESCSSPEVSKAIAIGFATVALVFFYFALFTATGVDSVILLLIALLFSFATYSALKSQYRVVFNADRRYVRKRFQAGIFKRESNSRCAVSVGQALALVVAGVHLHQPLSISFNFLAKTTLKFQ